MFISLGILLLAATLTAGSLSVNVINGEAWVDGNNFGKGIFNCVTVDENGKIFMEVKYYTKENPEVKEKKFLVKNQSMSKSRIKINTYEPSVQQISVGGGDLPENIPDIKFPDGFPFNGSGFPFKGAGFPFNGARFPFNNFPPGFPFNKR